MPDIKKLIQQLASQEKLLSATEFLAPCVRGGKVRTSVDKIIYTFIPEPKDFQGWGIFRPIDNQVAEIVDEPTLPQIAQYLNLLKPLKLRLAHRLLEQTWLAYPINESDMQQRFGIVKPLVVNLVDEAEIFEVIIARYDHGICWYDEVDRRGDPEISIKLGEFLRQEELPENISFNGMTPEMVTTYNLAWQQTIAYQQRNRHRLAVKGKAIITSPQNKNDDVNSRLEKALQQGGGQLNKYSDRGEFWQVEWTTGDGETHISAIAKNDLTVMSSGICLSGRDRDFDLPSLVGVIEQSYNY